MKPCWLAQVPETIETSFGFSYISIITNERMTYLPLYDRQGHFSGHVSMRAEAVNWMDII